MKRFDVVVIGSGPAGHQAAVAAASAGATAAIVERDRRVGGACLHRGTIPSKTLREAALSVREMQRGAERLGYAVTEQLRMDHLTGHLRSVIDQQVVTLDASLERHGVARVHGTARVRDPRSLEICRPGGPSEVVQAQSIIIATGSRPRTPPGMPIDHEHILDSDSILSLEYLPASITILGAGVIACEYASIFAVLGVDVTIIDRGSAPLAFLDPELSAAYRRAFEAMGGTYLPGANVGTVRTDWLSEVTAELDDGRVITTERMMVALGRVPNVERLGLDAVGVELDSRGRVVVDEHGRSACPSIYAVGDVIGAPALASASMDQGRRAVHHALGLPAPTGSGTIPAGIYTVPEIAAVGLTEEQARAQHGDVCVGRARFSELARGQISGGGEGMLKLITDAQGEVILGVGIVGEGAAELVALGQIAMLLGGGASAFVDNIFNFPTMAEAYRVAALEVTTAHGALASRAA